jgi:hypothetical protein
MKYVIIDNEGDILADSNEYQEPNLPFYPSIKEALTDAETISWRRDKKDSIYVFKLVKTIKGIQ